MDCPRTGKPMETKEIGGVKVDISTGCGGIWFDNFEIEKFDEPAEQAGEKLVAAAEPYYRSIDSSERLHCPKCGDEIVMTRHFFSVSRQVEIDECYGCGGMWLDPGELQAIRDLFDSEEERKGAADAYFVDLFKSPEMTAMKGAGEKDLKRAKRFAQMFKYMCPSTYIPGKQDWGAF